MNQTLADYGGEQSPEAILRSRLGEHDFLVDVFQMGEEMRLFVETPVGTYLLNELKGRFNGALTSLLTQPDPTTDAARAALADARSAWAGLSLIEETLRAGTEATRMMDELDSSR